MDNLEFLNKGLEGLKEQSEELFKQLSDPQVIMSMSKEQLEFINDARASLNFKGLTPKEIADKLNEIVTKYKITDIDHGA